MRTESDSFSCGPDQRCDIEVTDIFFEETFIAEPGEGYEFEGWVKDSQYLCGGSSKPCTLSTAGFEGNEALMIILESDDVWLLEPRFKMPDSWASKAVKTTGVGVSTCVLNGKLYAIGLGWSVGDADRVEEYDPSTDTWTPRAGLPTPSAWATARAVNGRCYVIGGGPGGFRETITTVQEYNPITDRWRTRAPLPLGRSAAASAVVDDKICVVGGGNTFAFNVPGLSAVAIYDPETNQWSTGADMPTPRVGVAAGAIEGYVYVFGGSNNELVNSNLVHRYGPVKDQWAKVANYPRKVDFASASVHDGMLCVVGGFDPTNSNSTSA